MIDDNQMDHFIMQRLFQHCQLFKDNDYSEDGRLSLNTLRKNHSDEKNLPDLILLDLNMPNFSGWDFLTQFQKLYPKLKKKIDVIIVSSSFNPVDILKSKSYSFVKQFITKPVSIEVLESLNRLYKGKKVQN